MYVLDAYSCGMTAPDLHFLYSFKVPRNNTNAPLPPPAAKLAVDPADKYPTTPPSNNIPPYGNEKQSHTLLFFITL